MARPRVREHRLADPELERKVRHIAGTYSRFYAKAEPFLAGFINDPHRLMVVLKGYPARQDEIEAVQHAVYLLYDRPRLLLEELGRKIAEGGGKTTLSFADYAALHEAITAGD